MADAGIVANDQFRPIAVTHREMKTALAVNHHIVANHQSAMALDPGYKDTGSQVAPVARAVRLEQWLADEYADHEEIDGAAQQEDGKYGPDYNAWRR